MRSPTSTLRLVMTPSNGAVMRVKPCSWRSRCTLASAAARFAVACVRPLRRSSSSCCETTSFLRSASQRSTVLFASARLAAVWPRAASACDSCWSISGDSMTASSSPFVTWLPMSLVQRLT
jgi:hypothetical protein